MAKKGIKWNGVWNNKTQTMERKNKKARLTWFGHLARMDEKTPVKIALKYAMANYPKKKADQNKPG